MKEQQQCPKCDGRKVWQLDNFQGADMRRMRVFELIGFFDVFICAACGYTEFYARDFDDLAVDAEAGINLIDRSGDHAGPYR